MREQLTTTGGPRGRRGSVVCIGNFDGVHRGHQHLLEQVARRARERGARPLALTFEPHPLAVLAPEHAPVTLTPLDVKRSLLRDAGMADVLVIPFTEAFACLTPECFVRGTLGAPRVDAVDVMVGENFHFGQGGAGDVGTLRDLGRRHGFVVTSVDLLADESTVSSSRVRGLITQGSLEAAARALGRPHRIRGTVETDCVTGEMSLQVDSRWRCRPPARTSPGSRIRCRGHRWSRYGWRGRAS
jgi:riboflavin kinase/FMN adenylyltransferase